MGIRIIGTSHISKQSIQENEQEVAKYKPDIIALELDVKRAMALSQEQTRKVSILDARKIGFKGYVFARIGQFVQHKLGEMVGVKPGSEMKTALKLAYKQKINIALIDQPVEITLRNFSRELTWKEKFRFLNDIFLGIFFKKRQIKKLGLKNFDLSKVPTSELVDKLLLELEKNYPNIHKTLVSDRNKFMVRALLKLQKANLDKDILVIVGAGHKKEMEKMLGVELLKLDAKKYGEKLAEVTADDLE